MILIAVPIELLQFTLDGELDFGNWLWIEETVLTVVLLSGFLLIVFCHKLCQYLVLRRKLAFTMARNKL